MFVELSYLQQQPLPIQMQRIHQIDIGREANDRHKTQLMSELPVHTQRQTVHINKKMQSLSKQSPHDAT